MKTKKDYFYFTLDKAIAGDSNAQYEIASIFEDGLQDADIVIVAPDKEKSYYWYQQSSLNGNFEAMLRYADYLSEGIGCDRNVLLAIELYEKCIENGSSIAANNLGIVYRDKKDFEKAFEYYSLSQTILSKDANKSVSTLPVGLCYFYGLGVKKDIVEAKRIFKNIVENSQEYNCTYDIDESNYLLGLIYLQEQNIEKAREYLLAANVEEDHRSAQEMLSIIGK